MASVYKPTSTLDNMALDRAVKAMAHHRIMSECKGMLIKFIMDIDNQQNMIDILMVDDGFELLRDFCIFYRAFKIVFKNKKDGDVRFLANILCDIWIVSEHLTITEILCYESS